MARQAKKNKRPFWYALYDRTDETKDEDGNYTGGRSTFYHNPVFSKANISAARGTSDSEVFGLNLQYDRTITTGKTPLTEQSALWIDIVPEIKPDGTTDTRHDYIVTRVARGLTDTLVAISKVQ